MQRSCQELQDVRRWVYSSAVQNPKSSLSVPMTLSQKSFLAQILKDFLAHLSLKGLANLLAKYDNCLKKNIHSVILVFLFLTELKSYQWYQ